MTVKTISLLLIVAYFLLPSLCYAHPCELYTSASLETVEIAVDQPASDCPEADETDNCEATSCCGGQVHHSAYWENPTADANARQLPVEPHLALPRLIDRIFVPPQNRT